MCPQVNSNPKAQFLISWFERRKGGPTLQAADGVVMNDLNDSEQQTHSQETLSELNPQELLQRIHAAETAIFLRLRGMRISSIDLVEGQAIQDALDGLMRLTKETLEFANSLVEVTRAAGRAWA
jgi:hypothetical protein